MKFKPEAETDGTRATCEPRKRVEKMTGIVKPVVAEPSKPAETMPMKGEKGWQMEALSRNSLSKDSKTENGPPLPEDAATENLTQNFLNCKISSSETVKTTGSEDLCHKISDLKISDERPTGSKGTAEKLLERGPTGGVASSYCQNVSYYNQMGSSMYAGINNFNSMGSMQFQNQYQYGHQVFPMQNSGKRSRDFEEQPFKFTRPLDQTNNLNDPTKVQNANITYSKVSSSSCSGGQVTVKSPEIELQMPSWHDAPLTTESSTSGEFDLMKLMNQSSGSFGTLPQPVNMNILENQDSFIDQTQLNLPQMIDKWQGGNAKRTSFSTEGDATSEGYCSDVPSPCSEIQDSPAEPNPYSPPPPPSNSSVDSGVYVPTVPSPGSHLDASSPGSGLTGLDQSMFDASMFSPPPIEGQNPTIGYNEQLPEFTPNLNFNNISEKMPTSFKAPIETAAFTDHSQYIDDHLLHLKDVMDTIADELQKDQMKQRKVKPLDKLAQEATPPRPLQAQRLQKNIPTVSVPPNQTSRCPPNQPSRGPTISNAPTVPAVPTANAPLVFMNGPQNSVPVPVASNPVTSGTGISQTPVSTGQIVIIQAQPQPTPAILFVTPPPQSKATQQTKYKPIRPRIQPNPPPAKDSNSTNKNIPVTVMSTTSHKPECNTTKPTSMVAPVMAQAQQKPPQIQHQNSKCVNQLNIARRLLATLKKDDLEDKDEKGDTYIHIAVRREDKFMVQALLERIERENLQTLIDTQNDKRQTPLYLAVSENQPEIVTMLIKHGADVNLLAERMAPNGQKEVNAAVHCAVSYGKEYLACLEALLASSELNIDMCNSDGCTALHCAILEHNQPQQVSAALVNSKPVIEALVKAGADPNAQDKKSGKTAFMYALETRDYSLVETLLGLVDPAKVRSYFRTQAFDGRTCIKIMESQKTEFPKDLYEKLNAMLNSRNLCSRR